MSTTWLDVDQVLCLCFYGLSAVEVCQLAHKKTSNISLLDTANLYSKCSCTKSYFLILAMHKEEQEQKIETRGCKRECLPSNPLILKNLFAHKQGHPPPLFSLIVFALTSVCMWPECRSSSHRNACYTG